MSANRPRLTLLGAAALAGALLGAPVAATGTGAAPATPPQETPEFTAAYLADEANIAAGGEIWAKQCRHCHGASAYPGKAPKLKPRKYKPGFVFKRVTKGFRKMPGWKEVYSLEERMAIVAYVLSSEFSP